MLLALLRFRDEADRLPGFLANVAPHVDGIVALDHGSTDGSTQLVASEPKLVELLDHPRSAPFDDGALRRIVTEAGVRHGADWLLGLDADERLERSFGQRVRDRITTDCENGHDAYAIPIVDLWDRRDSYRIDGVWGQKARTTLFRASESHSFDDRPLHAQWASTSGPAFGAHPRIDARIYHLGMLGRKDRIARQARYQELDPERRWQRIGYDYLTDETGLRLERIEPGREYEDVIGGLDWGSAAPAAQFDDRGELRAFVLHHTALMNPLIAAGDPAGEAAYVRGIERFHLEDRGWSAIGYHFVIMPSGHVYAGRPLWARGAHTGDYNNRGTIAIAFAGNFEVQLPRTAALKSLETLRGRLAPPGEAVPLLAHGDLNPTRCPGRFLRDAVGLSARSAEGV